MVHRRLADQETVVCETAKQAGGVAQATLREEGKSGLEEREDLMKTTIKSKRRTLLSILCAGVVATFLGGCAEGPYVMTYDTGYPATYYTTTRTYDYYTYPYSYYDEPVVRSGVRYNDAYGPRYYGSYYGVDWY
jgi:hypothetical protein